MRIPIRINIKSPWPGDKDKSIIEIIKGVLNPRKPETWKELISRIMPKPKIDWGNLKDKIK